MFDLSKLIIDPKSFGSTLFLTSVKPAYDYKDGVRVSDTPYAFKYEISLPEHQLDKLSVKIEGPPQMETPESYLEVGFEDLKPSLYWTPNGYQLKVTARRIFPVNGKKN